MGTIISVTNQKGGTGKTTSTINLSAALAYYGKKVLLIDMDPQSNLTNGLGVYTVVDGKKINDCKTIYECLKGELSVENIVRETDIENLHILPATLDLANAELVLSNEYARESLLSNALNQAELNYDYVLIDCNPSLGLLTVNALVACNCVIIPLEASVFSMQGVGNLIKVIKLVKQKLNNKINICGVFLTRIDARTNISKDFAEELKKTFQDRVFDTMIHQNVKIAESQVQRKSVIEYAKESTGAKEYLKLAKEVIGRVEKKGK